MRNAMKRAGTVAAGAAAAMAYAGPVRRWMRSWGATPDEERRALPGDDLVPDAVEQSTRAIGIAAPPAQIWPHLQRIGDWQHVFTDLLARIPGANVERAPEAPRAPLQEGDVIPTGASEMRVVRVEPERALVLRNAGKGFDYSWSTVLEPDAATGLTRVVTRVRYRGSRALFAAVEPVAFAATRRWLLSLRRRAEDSAAQRRLEA